MPSHAGSQCSNTAAQPVAGEQGRGPAMRSVQGACWWSAPHMSQCGVCLVRVLSYSKRCSRSNTTSAWPSEPMLRTQGMACMSMLPHPCPHPRHLAFVMRQCRLAFALIAGCGVAELCCATACLAMQQHRSPAGGRCAGQGSSHALSSGCLLVEWTRLRMCMSQRGVCLALCAFHFAML